jgi:DtxR family Mn-dependent transcriptional regulator
MKHHENRDLSGPSRPGGGEPMELSERAEEILETLWIQTQEEGSEAVPLEQLEAGGNGAVEQLLRAGCISVSDGQVRLDKKGLTPAANVIRRHRLAERLLIDVLSTSDDLLDDRACKFEHVLDRGVAASICSLLGHPKVCPHGKPIPPGECCREDRARLQRVVAPLSQMASGARGKIAYVHAPQTAKLQKLMSMGILPGAPIVLQQSFPSYVFQVRQERFAVDKEIADSIYVRLMQSAAPAEEEREEPRRSPHIWRRLRLRRRRQGSRRV